jgi:hypothetical protein
MCSNGVTCLPVELCFSEIVQYNFNKHIGLRIEFVYILKVANIRCFILIAVEIFHDIIRKLPRTKEIRCCLIFLHPVKNSLLTRAIFIRPDSELIRESVCACAKLFVDEENVGLNKNPGLKNLL